MGILGDFVNGFLPEDPDKNAAARQGLLSFGTEMLKGRGNFGGILGNSLQSGAQSYQGSLAAQQRQAMEGAQLKLLQNKDARAQKLDQMVSSAFGGDGSISGAATGNGPVGAEQALAQGQAAGSIGPTLANAQRMGQISSSVQQLPQRKNANFPLSLNQVVGLKALGGPDMLDAYKYANEGVERKQGSSYELPDGSFRSFAKLGDGQVQANDGSISNANGYVGALSESEAAKARAQQGAQAEYDVLDPNKFVDEDGNPILQTRAGMVNQIKSRSQLPQIGQPRPTILPPVAQRGANFPVVTPQQQQQRDGTRLSILQAERQKLTDPRDLEAIDREIANATRQAGGAQQTGGVPRLQSPIQARAQQGALETNLKAGQELNENWIKNSHNPVQLEGKAAKTTLGQLETIRNIGLQTGWGTEAKAAAANFLGSFGVQDAAKYAGNVQSFQQVAMERNMTMLQAQSGPQTEGDSQRAQQTFLQLRNTPAANAFIADLTGANARLSAKKASFYNEALPLARASGDLTEIDRRWSKIAPSVWADPALARYKAK